VQALRETLLERFGELKQGIEQRHGEGLKALNDNLRGGIETLQRQVAAALDRNAQETGRRMEKLTESTDKRLQEISGQVEKRLTEGFEKTTATFADVLKRLALIDDAQKKITELSTNVVSLQEVLADRTSRGAFGEVQLHGLVSNVLPESSYAMQFSLSNGSRVDCMIFLPEPTGNVPIDSKFPLDNYRRKMDTSLSDADRKVADREFVRNVRTHIQDIAAKYVIPGETANLAVMFIPAEAVFAEIHGHHRELVDEAQRAHVVLASPTTLWAILTTAGAVLKDAATRKQVHIIQEHLGKLAIDFERFQKRMGDLAKHIDQAHRDVEHVNTSARKITSRFTRIERLELGEGEPESVIDAEAEEAPGDGDDGRSESAGA
jgi:DNA recombination protein RmuC